MKFRFLAPALFVTLCLSLLIASVAFADESVPPLRYSLPKLEPVLPTPPMLEGTVELRVLDAATVLEWFDLTPPSAQPKPFDRNTIDPGASSSGEGRPAIELRSPYPYPRGDPYVSPYTNPRANPYVSPYPYLALPGNEFLTAVDGKNAVRVRGSQEFIDAVKRNIEPLDKPLHTVIFDAVIYKVQSAEIKKNEALAPEIWPREGVLTPEQLRHQINGFESFVRDHNAGRLELAPRVVPTGQAARVEASETILIPQAVNNGLNGTVVAITSNTIVSVASRPFQFRRGLQITPEINGDGTLKLTVVPFHSNAPSLQDKELETEEAQTIPTARDAESLLWELNDGTVLSHYKGKYRWFIVVTPRVAREPKAPETK